MPLKTQPPAVLVLGLWLGGSLAMWFVATQNFRTVDRILGQPTPQAGPVLRTLPAETPRPLLRHLSSELNRFYFRAWGWAQLVLGAALAALLTVAGRRSDALLAAAMVLLVAVLLAVITPQIITLGRTLDFVPRNPPPPEMSTFWKLHAAFTVLDGLKVLTGLVLAWRLSVSAPPR